MLNRLLVEINNRSLRAKPNETLSSIEYKHRLLLAVDQPRDVQQDDWLSRAGDFFLFRALVERRSSLYRSNKTKFILLSVASFFFLGRR